MALECGTFCFGRISCVGAVYLDRRSGTLAVVVVGTVVCFAVDLDRFASASIGEFVAHRASGAFLEASAACLVCIGSVFAGDVDITFGAELILIVDTFDC